MAHKLPYLPATEDKEFWEDAEVQHHTPVRVNLCSTHTRENWTTHTGYVWNADGSISCQHCPWGTKLAGYYRVQNGCVIDLRTRTTN